MNNGDNYEPESLKVMQAALDGYLREKGCNFSILKDRNFITSRKSSMANKVDWEREKERLMQ